MLPSDTSQSRAARRAQVLLPEPEGPTSAVTAPTFAEDLFFIVGEPHLVENDVVAVGGKGVRPFCRPGIVHFHQAVCRHLGEEHLRNERQGLVEGGIDPGDDEQEQEEQHEVDLSRENEPRPDQDGRGDAEAHDDAGRIDEDAVGQFPSDHGLLMPIDFVVQVLKETFFLIRCLDFPDIFKSLLDAVRHLETGLLHNF